MSNKDTKKLIIDCDPGCDDALALLLAIRCGKYEDITITTVAGNVQVGRTTHNAVKIASLAKHGLEKPAIKIYRGSAVSLAGIAPNVTSVHGRDGLGDVPINLYPKDLSKITVEDKSAVEYLKDLASLSGDKFDLVCTGPLTNIAMALSLTPKPEELLDKFERIVVMGGVFEQRGNITPSAEFNFFFDPLAVRVFLNVLKEYKSWDKVVFVPLDVTERVQLTFFDYFQDNLEIGEKATKGSEIGLWTLCMLQKYFYFHAFGAKILKHECAFNKCTHKNLSKCKYCGRTKYAEIKKKIEDSRKSGSSGTKKHPRFCHLHDPLAVWYMIDKNKDITKEAIISTHIGYDAMRGTLIIEDEKCSLYNREQFRKGTKVKYLSPEKIAPSLIQNFKQTLYKCCGLKQIGE